MFKKSIILELDITSELNNHEFCCLKWVYFHGLVVGGGGLCESFL